MNWTNKQWQADKPREECGVFGVFNIPDAVNFTYYGLHALQHRGQEGAGISVINADKLLTHKGEGLVTEVFDTEHLAKLKGDKAIGHVRYSTTGGGGVQNVQPISIHAYSCEFAVCHNGNIVNAEELKIALEFQGSIFQCTSDSEIIAHLIQKEKGSFEQKILHAAKSLEGAFSFLILTKDALYALRDKNGLRPLVLGKIDQKYCLSSESCAFNVVGAEFVRDIEPGELLKIDTNGLTTFTYTKEVVKNMCAMEYIYFSRPDSEIEQINVHASRKKCGTILAQESNTEADIVIGVPDSSISAAMGFAEEKKMPYEMGLIKNKYVGRTFIQPNQLLREKSVKMKLSVVASIIKNKRIILIDDSIVRGTTSKKIVSLLREAGATEIHVKIASPKIINPCFYGVDTSRQQELIGSKYDDEQMRQYIESDSLQFLSLEGLFNAIGRPTLCTACFTGKYPTPIFSLEKLLQPHQINA